MTTVYLETDQDGAMLVHRNQPRKSVKTIEINELFGNVLFYGKEFIGDDTFASNSRVELVIWADGRGPVEINIISVVD